MFSAILGSTSCDSKMSTGNLPVFAISNCDSYLFYFHFTKLLTSGDIKLTRCVIFHYQQRLKIFIVRYYLSGRFELLLVLNTIFLYIISTVPYLCQPSVQVRKILIVYIIVAFPNEYLYFGYLLTIDLALSICLASPRVKELVCMLCF